MSDDTLAAAGANLAVEAVGAEVLTALVPAGVESIVLKGPTLAAWLDDPTRASSDVDLLIRASRRDHAHVVLSRLGYRTLLDGEGHAATTWQRAQRHVRVDVHTSVEGAGAPGDTVYEAFASCAARARIGDVDALVAAGEGRLALLALHAAQHGAEEPSPLRDLRRGIELSTPDDWQRAADFAVRIEAREAFATGLRLVPEGKVLANQLGLGTETTTVVALRASSPPHTSLTIERLSSAGWRERAQAAWRELAPSPSFMRDWRPELARRGRLGLALAYLYRPLWLAWWAPRGYLAWRRAKRVAEASRRGRSS